MKDALIIRFARGAAIGLSALIAGCAILPEAGAPAAKAPPVAPPAVASPAAVRPVPPAARTVDEFDTSTEADKAAARAVPAGGRDLGLTIASLGAAGEPGFWLKTPLVTKAGPGRVLNPATGQSAKVELIPIEGAASGGSRMSLAAMRLIGAPLTGLPEIRVFALE